jgi:hypothetical protein
MFVGGGSRPKTAAMQMGSGLLRPPTGITNFNGKRGNNVTTGGAYKAGHLLGQRAISANVGANPKVKRYEDVISRLKRMLEMEKKSLRMVKTMCSKEIEIKN